MVDFTIKILNQEVLLPGSKTSKKSLLSISDQEGLELLYLQHFSQKGSIYLHFLSGLPSGLGQVKLNWKVYIIH